MMRGLGIEGNNVMRHFSGDMSENGEEEETVHPLYCSRSFFACRVAIFRRSYILRHNSKHIMGSNYRYCTVSFAISSLQDP
jgi:hypothetical protein